MSLLEKLNWRYATKKFDPSKKIPAEKLQQLLDTVKLAPSSYGLQHYKIVVVEDPALREQLRSAAYNQPQLTDASQVVVFAAETNINADYVEQYANEIVKVRNTTHEALAGFKQVMVGAVANKSEEDKLVWAQKQAYIALGVLVSAAADLDIDICPMEGFDAKQFDEILGLKDYEVTATVIATIGYRAADDPTSQFAKVRKPDDKLFIRK